MREKIQTAIDRIEFTLGKLEAANEQDDYREIAWIGSLLIHDLSAILLAIAPKVENPK